MAESKMPIQFMYILVDNIPVEYHCPDMRNFFSYSIENESFILFNYRHRPNVNKKCNICICKIKSNKFDELVKLYDKKNWINSSGVIHLNKCSIVKIKLSQTKASASDNDHSSLSIDELSNLLEFRNIPKWMPNGNVGTPTSVFIEYINNASFPVSLISKIGINLKTFKKHKKRKFSNVKYNYEDENAENDDYSDDDVDDTSEEVASFCPIEVATTANGFKISEEIDSEKQLKELNYLRMEKRKKEISDANEENNKNELSDEDDCEHVEEWERHEALHDDCTKQDRTSPYFFENEIELQWEKGGSGLVFYTDNNFWKDEEGKDFDAETADDLDVDMSVYYESNGGDKDARDMIEMNREEMRRSGAEKKLYEDNDEEKKNPFSGSKKSSNFGRDQLKKLGWKEGEGVGLRNGLIEPLDASDGKLPKDKTGLGYYGPKVDREKMTEFAKKRRLDQSKNNPYSIGSKFNLDSSKTDSLFRRYDPTMKYRSKK